MLMSCKKDALWILWYVKIVLVVQRTGLGNIHMSTGCGRVMLIFN